MQGSFFVVARTMVMEDSAVGAVDAADDEINWSIRTMVSKSHDLLQLALFFTIRQNCNTMESSKVAKFGFQRSDVAAFSEVFPVNLGKCTNQIELAARLGWLHS